MRALLWFFLLPTFSVLSMGEDPWYLLAWAIVLFSLGWLGCARPVRGPGLGDTGSVFERSPALGARSKAPPWVSWQLWRASSFAGAGTPGRGCLESPYQLQWVALCTFRMQKLINEFLDFSQRASVFAFLLNSCLWGVGRVQGVLLHQIADVTLMWKYF